MKRRISLLLALVIVLGSFSTAFAAVPTTGKEKAEFLNKQDILKGSESGDLMLDKKENRQNMVVMLSRLMQKETEAKAHGVEESAKFEDLTNNYYKPFVAWSVANNLIMGQSETKFGSHDNVTAQNYATVLLRALEYFSAENGKVEHENAYQLAEKLGLLEETGIKDAKEEITREQMSIMIYNALGTKMNGKDITLAKHLGITMPEPDKLTAEVKSENLKEIKLVLNNAKLIKDQKALRDVTNYAFAAGKVHDVRVNGNEVIVELEKAMVAGREYELRVRDIDADLNNSYKFVARDNTAPEVLEAKVLGTYGIKVIMSEPVTNVKETSFLIDGKNIAMKIEQFGREITLRPYHREAFPKGEHKLTVKPLQDFAGFKSLEKDFDINVVEIEGLPEVTNIDAKHDSIVVTFNMDIHPDSLEKGTWGNVHWSEVRGRQKVAATQFKLLAGNRVEYTFAGEDRLPGRAVEVTVNGVDNYSRKSMKEHKEVIYPELDYSRPEVIKSYVRSLDKKDNKDNIAEVELTFNKTMSDNRVAEIAALVKERNENRVKTNDYKAQKAADKADKAISNYVSLFDTTRNKYGDLIKSDRVVDAVKSVTIKGDKLVVNFEDKIIKAGEVYILEVGKFSDDSLLKNTMLDYSLQFREGSNKDFRVEKINHNFRNDGETLEIEVNLSDAVDRQTAEVRTNYVFKLVNGSVMDLKDLGGEVIVSNNGKLVTLVLDETKTTSEGIKLKELVSLKLKDSIKDLDGNRLNHEAVYTFETGLTDLIDQARKDLIATIGKARALNRPELKEEIEKAEKALLEAKTVKELEDANKALKDAIDKLEPQDTLKLEAIIENTKEGKVIVVNNDKITKDNISKVVLNEKVLSSEDYGYGVDKGVLRIALDEEFKSAKVTMAGVEYEVVIK